MGAVQLKDSGGTVQVAVEVGGSGLPQLPGLRPPELG